MGGIGCRQSAASLACLLLRAQDHPTSTVTCCITDILVSPLSPPSSANTARPLRDNRRGARRVILTPLAAVNLQVGHASVMPAGAASGHRQLTGQNV